MRDSYLLFIFQLVSHLALIPMIIHGEWYHWGISLVVYFFTGCFGMTMTFHRLLSHRSWNSPKWFEYFGTIAGFYGLVGSPIAWVAVHKEHHHYTDQNKDPHSPSHHGFIKVQWLSMFDKVNPKYAAHLLRDPFQIFLHKQYFVLHLLIALVWLAIDPMLLLSFYLVPAAILWNAGSLINTLTHMVGYRNFATKDNSTNVSLLGYLVWGEGWHNNHHAHPNKLSFKEKWWELDIGAWFIKKIEVTK